MNNYSEKNPALLIDHYEHLKKSAISDEVIIERGYRSVERITRRGKSHINDQKDSVLTELGFSRSQLRVPGILMPVHSVDGQIVTYQYRPDNPRMDKKHDPPKAIKYENPKNSVIRFDVPPRCLAQLGNPAEPVYFTEGIKKADSLASQGACAVGLMGVWGFTGKNEFEGTVILADFKYIALANRICFIVYDSDVVTKPSVKQALDIFTELIRRRKGDPRILHLPAGPDGGKTGVDDYFAQGHSLQDLVATEKDVLPAAKSIRVQDEDYCIERGVMCWNKYEEKHGVVSEIPVPLCTFRAYITEEISEDDGADVKLQYRMHGQHGDNSIFREILVDQNDFDNMSWTKNWGVRARIRAGNGIKDKLRDAIQYFSEGAKMTNIYTHTGWRKIDGKNVYLTGVTAIGAENVLVKMPPKLTKYSIPKPTENDDPVKAFQTSLAFMDVADRSITLPLWAAMYLAPLCELLEPSFSIFLVGASGSYKSVLSGLALSHYGYFDHHHLPTNWSGTANAIEYLCFLLKDAPIVIDDWAPGVDNNNAKQLEVKAERIFRAQGNMQGRDRMGADTKTQSSYTPRGLIITSGEQLPSGHSVNARFFAIKTEREAVNIDKVSEAQALTRFYRSAMYYYIDYLKKALETPGQKEKIKEQWEKWRITARDISKHPRLPDAVASLFTGLNCGLACALEYKAITQKQADEITAAGWKLFNYLADEQSSTIEEERPGKRFLDGIQAVLRMKIGILCDFANNNDENRIPTPSQTLIGWKDRSEGFIYLDPDASYQVVKQYYDKIGEPFTFKRDYAFADLKRLGLTTCQPGRNKIQQRIYKVQMYVLKLKYNSIFPE